MINLPSTFATFEGRPNGASNHHLAYNMVSYGMVSTVSLIEVYLE